MEDTSTEIIYPPKPLIHKPKTSVVRPLISLLLFMVIAYRFMHNDLAFVLILTVVVSLHEAGHLLAMKIFNYTDLRIFFIPMFGALASGNKDQISQKQKGIILLAGPVPGIIFGVIFYYFSLGSDNIIFFRLAYIFIFLNLFNLFPFYPLDGGQLVKTIFFPGNQRATQIFQIISVIALALLFIFLKDYYLLVIPFLLILSAVRQAGQMRTRNGLIEKGLDPKKRFEDLTDEEYWKVRDGLISDPFYRDPGLVPGEYGANESENGVAIKIKGLLGRTQVQDLTVLQAILLIGILVAGILLPFLLHIPLPHLGN